MATDRQKNAAKKNIRKAQEKWKSMTHRARAMAMPQGKNRARPGTTGKGEYYRIEVRPRSSFTSFKTQDIGRVGHTQRIAGHRASGSWDTQAWLISKKDAHVEGGNLVADDAEVRKIIESLQSAPALVKGDIFKARPPRNVPEAEKPTPAQTKAYKENIKKAREARLKKPTKAGK
jgi:hypothetical protein